MYQELNDFLSPSRRGVEFELSLHGTPSVKDVVESVGVPHTELDVILVNGESVGFDRLIRDGDRIAAFPRFESLDITPILRLRPEPLRQPRFVLDVHLGRLAGYLRLFGFDALYRPELDDAALAHLSARDERILLTRDRGLLKRKEVSRGYCPRQQQPRRQLVEVLRRFDLLAAARPLTRCIACNGLLERVLKGEIIRQLPRDIAMSRDAFTRCRECGRAYWEGSHFDRLVALIETAAAEAACETTGSGAG